jgi:hypothetical protein
MLEILADRAHLFSPTFVVHRERFRPARERHAVEARLDDLQQRARANLTQGERNQRRLLFRIIDARLDFLCLGANSPSSFTPNQAPNSRAVVSAVQTRERGARSSICFSILSVMIGNLQVAYLPLQDPRRKRKRNHLVAH